MIRTLGLSNDITVPLGLNGISGNSVIEQIADLNEHRFDVALHVHEHARFDLHEFTIVENRLEQDNGSVITECTLDSSLRTGVIGDSIHIHTIDIVDGIRLRCFSGLDDFLARRCRHVIVHVNIHLDVTGRSEIRVHIRFVFTQLRNSIAGCFFHGFLVVSRDLGIIRRSAA